MNVLNVALNQELSASFTHNSSVTIPTGPVAAHKAPQTRGLAPFDFAMLAPHVPNTVASSSSKIDKIISIEEMYDVSSEPFNSKAQNVKHQRLSFSSSRRCGPVICNAPFKRVLGLRAGKGHLANQFR